jgi:uncharacterized integral membrane protein
MRTIIAIPILFLLVLFALSNRQQVQIGLWPTDYTQELPLSAAILVGMALAFLAGALLLWVSVLAARRRARRAEHTARLLEAQVAELKARLATSAVPGTAVVSR